MRGFLHRYQVLEDDDNEEIADIDQPPLVQFEQLRSRGEKTTMDETQLDAIRTVFENRVAIIQVRVCVCNSQCWSNVLYLTL